MMATCPCCGGGLNGPAPIEDVMAAVPPTLAAIIAALSDGQQMTAAALADAVYAGDAAGGPDWAMHNIRNAVHRQRHRLAGTGWRIVSVLGRSGGYRLVADQAEVLRPAVFENPRMRWARPPAIGGDRGLGTPENPVEMVEILPNINGGWTARLAGGGR